MPDLNQAANGPKGIIEGSNRLTHNFTTGSLEHRETKVIPVKQHSEMYNSTSSADNSLDIHKITWCKTGHHKEPSAESTTHPKNRSANTESDNAMTDLAFTCFILGVSPHGVRHLFECPNNVINLRWQYEHTL